MEPATGAYGDGLARHFRADANSHLVTRAIRKAKLETTMSEATQATIQGGAACISTNAQAPETRP